MSNWKTENSVRKLQSIIDSEIGYNSYRMARYLNDITVDLNYFTEYNDSIWGYKFLNIQDNDLAQSPKINVIKSVIDSLVSKLANQKVRPYFNPVNGLHSTRAIVKQAQTFFDIVFDKEKVNDKVSKAYRNACIFGIGYLFFNPITQEIEVPGGWQVAIPNTELGYGKPTKLLVEYKNLPVTQLDKYGIKGQYRSEYVNFKLFIDIVDHAIIGYVNNTKAFEKTFKAEVLPIVLVYHNKPIFGTKTISVVDELDGIQTNIDLINNKISAASQLTPGNVTYVETGSSLQPGDISQKTGLVYSVKMGPGHNNLPVVNVTPAPFDPMWNQLLESYIKQAYEIVGISQLSAQSKKPAGIDSGVALQTLEDVESDRFQTQVDNYIHAFVDLANVIIEVMEDDTILPKSVNTASYSWKDIRKQKELFKVQYSAASLFSNDPSTKAQQIMQWFQAGLMPMDQIGQYSDSPDLERFYADASAVSEAVDTVISNAIENDVYDIPDYIGYQQLLQKIIVEENKLYSSDDKESLEKIEKLKDILLEIMDENGFVDLSNEAIENDEGVMNADMNASSGIDAQVNALLNNDQFATPQESPINIGGVNDTQNNQAITGNI